MSPAKFTSDRVAGFEDHARTSIGTERIIGQEKKHGKSASMAPAEEVARLS